MHFLDSGSDVLNVLVEIIKKRHRNNFKRIIRTGKYLFHSLCSVNPIIGKRMAIEKLSAISHWRQFLRIMFFTCLINLYQLPIWRNKKFLVFFFLVLAYICIPFHSGGPRFHHPRHYQHSSCMYFTIYCGHYAYKFIAPVILGATYGGLDVTKEV